MRNINGKVLVVLGIVFTYLLYHRVKQLFSDENKDDFRPPEMSKVVPHQVLEDRMKLSRQEFEKVGNEPVQTIENNAPKFNDKPESLKQHVDPNIYKEHVIKETWKSKLIQSNNGEWMIENCQIRADFLRSELITPVKTTPIFIYKDSKNDESVSGSVAAKGSWDIDNVKKILEILLSDLELVFVDVGSDVGVYSLSAATSGNRVIAIDCCRGNVMRLCASMRAGKVRDQMTIVHNAISDTRGRFKPKEQMPKTKEKHPIEELSVDSILLDDILEIMEGYDTNIVLRIDLDDNEAKVLKGAEKFFKTVKVQYLLINIKNSRGNENGEFILEFLEKQKMDVLHEGNYNKADMTTWPDKILCKRRKGKSEF